MNVTKINPGEFSWAELATSDQKAAMKFYTSLFPWSGNEMPMGDQPPYVMLQVNGKNVGALYENKKAKPAWLCYVSVSSVDESAKKAKSLGAKLLQEPFDVMDVGRMATFQDPHGAKLALWQAKKHSGFDIVGDVGAVCWNELSTNDIEPARKFYSGLFPQWKLKVSPQYTEIHVGGNGIGGIHDMAKEMPPFWAPYFRVENCDASAKKSEAAGGYVGVKPTDIPNTGRFAMVADPQGATFAIIQLNAR